MNVVRYDPWRTLGQVAREFDALWNPALLEDESKVATAPWTPAVDIREEENRFVIEADIPGVDPTEIEVTMDNGVLTIKGERKLEKREEEGSLKRVERMYGYFHRRFTLPDSADAEHISANGHDGVLEVVIPKRASAQPRRIPIIVH